VSTGSDLSALGAQDKVQGAGM